MNRKSFTFYLIATVVVLYIAAVLFVPKKNPPEKQHYDITDCTVDKDRSECIPHDRVTPISDYKGKE